MCEKKEEKEELNFKIQLIEEYCCEAHAVKWLKRWKHWRWMNMNMIKAAAQRFEYALNLNQN